MTMGRALGLSAMVILGAALAPAAAEAQAAAATACTDHSQCPGGTVCAGGACVAAQAATQPQPQAQPQPYAPPPGYVPAPVYYQAQPVAPRATREVQAPITGLIVAGAVTFGVSYITNIFISLFGGTGSYDYLEWEAFRYTSFAPVVGPWVQLALKPGDLSQDSWAPYLIIDGIVQLAGAAMLIIGAAVPVTRTVYADNGGVNLTLVPVVTPEQSGLSLIGSF